MLVKNIVYGFRVTSQHAGTLASLGLAVAEPNHAQLYLALYAGGADASQDTVLLPRLALSEPLSIDTEVVEWIVPPNQRVPISGNGSAYWIFFTMSEDTLLTIVDDVAQDVWESTGTTKFGPIEERRTTDDLYRADAGLGSPQPSLFFKVVPSD
jgi:hypothetical protein